MRESPEPRIALMFVAGWDALYRRVENAPALRNRLYNPNMSRKLELIR